MSPVVQSVERRRQVALPLCSILGLRCCERAGETQRPKTISHCSAIAQVAISPAVRTIATTVTHAYMGLGGYCQPVEPLPPGAPERALVGCECVGCARTTIGKPRYGSASMYVSFCCFKIPRETVSLLLGHTAPSPIHSPLREPR